MQDKNSPLFYGRTPLSGSAAEDSRASHGIATIEICDDEVNIAIPDRFGRSTLYTLTGHDFTNLLGLIDQALNQPIAMEVTR